ncbi:MAG TPA: DUF2752 domain-containing protein [Actinomycetes bacterium]|jgi:hypothetical protein|nr:DUF2752 domain-containing protein [Actinomycetes bacterium]
MSNTETPARAARLTRPSVACLLAWRPTSTPERLALTGLVAAGASFVYPAASHATGLTAPCLLRLTTGIPCPMCGMTTAATSLAAGHLQAALAANPFVLLLAGMTLVMTVLMAARAAGLAPEATTWPPARQRHVRLVVGVLAVGSWLFQLHRFGRI